MITEINNMISHLWALLVVILVVMIEHQLSLLTLVHNMTPTSIGYLQYFCAVLCLEKSVRIRLS